MGNLKSVHVEHFKQNPDQYFYVGIIFGNQPFYLKKKTNKKGIIYGMIITEKNNIPILFNIEKNYIVVDSTIILGLHIQYPLLFKEINGKKVGHFGDSTYYIDDNVLNTDIYISQDIHDFIHYHKCV